MEVATLERREVGPLDEHGHVLPALGLAGRVLDAGSHLLLSSTDDLPLQVALPCTHCIVTVIPALFTDYTRFSLWAEYL